MVKKILFGLFILLMISVSFVAYNFYKNVKEPVSKLAFEAVPQNAALIIKEHNFSALYKNIKSNNVIWQLLTDSSQTAREIDQQLHYFDSLLSGPFKNFYTNTSILSSMHLSGAKSYNFVFYISLFQNNEKEIIQKLKNITKINPEKRAYDGVNIYTFKSDKKISLIIHQNTLVFSSSTVLIEDVIRQFNGKSSLLTDSSFSKVLSASSKAEDGNIYVNNTYFSKIIDQYLNKATREFFKDFENYCGWTELDLTIKPNTVALNGFSFTKDNNSINLFKNQDAQDIDMLNIIPYNAALIFHYGMSNTKTFIENRKNLLKTNNHFFNYQKFLDKQTEKYGIDLEVELLGNIHQEIASIITESQTDDFSANKFIVYKVKDKKQAKDNLIKIIQKISPEIDSTSFNEYEIYRLAISNVFGKLLGKPFVQLSDNYFTFFDEFVIFGNSPNALKNYLTSIASNKILANDENFKSFNENLSSSSNIFIYNNIARSVNLYKNYCTKNYIPIIDEKLSTFRKFEALAFQVTSEKNNLFYNNIYLKYNPIYKQETTSLWELALDTFTNHPPQIVMNHHTGAKEIIVQDNAHKLYLISNTGKIIWTKQLQEEVISKFYQIDAYKNNKLQLLFNTRSKIYLIDRNGNNVEKYPVKLPTSASNEVTPLDYDKNRNYRILIGCMDNMVYNYDVAGNLVKGWEYQPAKGYARSTIKHFAIKGKDYIVVPLSTGKIKVVERTGKDRITLKNILPTNQPIFLKVSSSINKSYLLTADTNATILKLYFNDTKSVLKIDNVPTYAKFTALDYDGNSILDYVFYWDNIIIINNSDKKELYKNSYQQPINSLPMSFKNDKTSLGVVSGNKIYLVNDGILADGFPLAGSTAFCIEDINKDNILNLVVAHQNMIYTYNLK